MRLGRCIEQAVAGFGPAVPDGPEQLACQSLILDEPGIMCRNCHVGFRQYHFHISKDRLEIRPVARHLFQQPLVGKIVQRLPGAIPAGEHHAGLCPAEYPGNRTQVFDGVAGLAAGGA